MNSIPLLAVAHGSRDPRSAATVSAIVARLRARGVDARLCFLDLNAPSVEQVIDVVAAQGHRGAIVVPMLLGNAFHARVDLPGLLAAARRRHPQLTLTQADVLGDDPRLIAAVRDRILETGVRLDDPGVGVALAAVGSSSAAANARTRRIADTLTAGTAWRAVTCFATAAEPSVTQAVSQLSPVRTLVVAPWFLAPGLLTERVAAAANDIVESCDDTHARVSASPSPTAPTRPSRTDGAASMRAGSAPGAPRGVLAATIGAHEAVVEVVLDRYAAAALEVLPRSA